MLWIPENQWVYRSINEVFIKFPLWAGTVIFLPVSGLDLSPPNTFFFPLYNSQGESLLQSCPSSDQQNYSVASSCWQEDVNSLAPHFLSSLTWPLCICLILPLAFFTLIFNKYKITCSSTKMLYVVKWALGLWRPLLNFLSSSVSSRWHCFPCFSHLCNTYSHRAFLPCLCFGWHTVDVIGANAPPIA